eukprot:scaffold743_cov267-Pinguiococcus_pyrenoidosus.AAC.31
MTKCPAQRAVLAMAVDAVKTASALGPKRSGFALEANWRGLRLGDNNHFAAAGPVAWRNR